MSKSLGNVVDPAVLVEGGKNEKQDPAYGADVLRLWVSSVDYSADVPLGPGIVKQLAEVYRKVRNTARYLLGNLHDFNPDPTSKGGDAVPIAELPLLDRWMLMRTAELIKEVTEYFPDHSGPSPEKEKGKEEEEEEEETEKKFTFEPYRFAQALQNFCVVDLSNFYLDIAKDRLYVSGKNDFRRRSCQTVLSLVVESLAGLMAPVLCHLAEDIWQNLPYKDKDKERSVFERGWPKAPDEWLIAPLDLKIPEGEGGADLTIEEPKTPEEPKKREEPKTLEELIRLLKLNPQELLGAVGEIIGMRNLVNRQLQIARAKSSIGASLETRLLLHLEKDSEHKLARNLNLYLQLLKISRHYYEVDNIRDWLLVSDFDDNAQFGDGSTKQAFLITPSKELGITIGLMKAPGQKCERCWHYETDIGSHDLHPTLCKRCVQALPEASR
jgi:isoleucyl-tRNA synthetase